LAVLAVHVHVLQVVRAVPTVPTVMTVVHLEVPVLQQAEAATVHTALKNVKEKEICDINTNTCAFMHCHAVLARCFLQSLHVM
jgi:hypothetical protein